MSEPLVQPVGTGRKKKPTHVDDFISFGTRFGSDEEVRNEDYARWMLMHFRLPALERMSFDQFMKGKKLFCTYEGKRYRVIGASRLGDVWLTSKYADSHGYEHRVMVDDCTNWTKKLNA